MAQIFHQSMDRLRRRVMELSGVVEGQIAAAVRAIHDRDPEAAREAIEADAVVNHDEQEIEEECLHLLALHQPVAFDLRMLASMVKMTGRLERMGNLAVDIAELAQLLATRPEPREIPFDLVAMTRTTREMLRMSLDAMLELDVDLAQRVRELDDVVDDINRGMYPAVCDAIRADPDQCDVLILLMGVSRKLERVADYACGIAKEAMYLARGEIVRHDTPEETRPPDTDASGPDEPDAPDAHKPPHRRGGS
ncbi:MAG: phosphate signaling complex protein PhoU [Phycisphaeraceae bacterium]